MLYPAMDVQKASRPEGTRDLFSTGLSESEFALLRKFVVPSAVEAFTPEIAHLRNLGLVIADGRSGVVQLSPLGKAWLLSQRWLRAP